jgi:putative ABC transport system permease protein
LVYALLALAVFIALLGIANTLALSIFERTRELGLLWAVGMTRRQLRSTVPWELVIIALLGTQSGS